jgi:LPXTG-site transpeptidase (sortase) family protein
VGLVIAAGAGWQWLGKVRHVAQQQKVLDRMLAERWAQAGAAPTPQAGAAPTAPAGATPTAPAPDPAASGATGLPAAARPAPAGRIGSEPVPAGTAIARLHLPTLDQTLVVVEGTTDAQLAKGPGRIPATAPLGAPGNTAVAGHRYPGVFWNLDRLSAGDPVVVETATTWLVYRTARTVIVEPADTSVLAEPADGEPTLLTLITCEPRLSTSQRLVKQAVLVRADPRAGPAPRELTRRAPR